MEAEEQQKCLRKVPQYSYLISWKVANKVFLNVTKNGMSQTQFPFKGTNCSLSRVTCPISQNSKTCWRPLCWSTCDWSQVLSLSTEELQIASLFTGSSFHCGHWFRFFTEPFSVGYFFLWKWRSPENFRAVGQM